MQTNRKKNIFLSFAFLAITLSVAFFSYNFPQKTSEQTTLEEPETGALQSVAPLTIVQDEYNSFLKRLSNNQCISLPSHTRYNDAHTITGDCWENPRGRIWFDQEADGYAYQLRFAYSGKCLEPQDENPNAKLVQRTCHRGDYERPQVSESIQLWNITPQANNQISIVHANSGYAVTAVKDDDDIYRLYLAPATQSDSQLFSFHNKVTHNSDPNVMGMWGNLISWPFVPVHAAALYDDTIVSWSSNETSSFTSLSAKFSWSSTYDVPTGTFVTANNPTHDMFCAGTVLLEDGSLLASGGNPQANQTSHFDPSSKTWSVLSPMSQERWYGTNVLTGSGEVLAGFAKGAQEVSELYSPASNNWNDLPGANTSDMRDEQDLGNTLAANIPTNYSSSLQWYAFLHTAPDGRVFNPGPLTTMHWYGTDGDGTTEVAGSPPNASLARQYGSSIMYDVGKLLVSGGSDPTLNLPPLDYGDSGQPLNATDTAFTVDINAATPVIEPIDNMNSRRSNHDSVVLPTGEVFVVGGTKSGVLFNDTGNSWWPEIWNPDSRTWRTVAPISTPRSYHSWALLVRDGRVLVGGGGLCGDCTANHPDAQFYYPPYLFSNNGQASNRPIIFDATSEAQVGSAITVSTDKAIDKLNLVRLSSVTHSINTDQRFIPLAFEQSNSNQYHATLSSNTNVLTPGMYWLFAVDAQGVPSEGHVIQIKSLAEHNEPLLEMASGNDTLELKQGTELNIPLASTGFDSSSLGASAIDLPAGIYIDQQTHALAGKPQNKETGSFILSVSDGTKQRTQRIDYNVSQGSRTAALGGASSEGGGGSSDFWMMLLLCFPLIRRFTQRPCGM